jgi:hypothetical protein
VALEILQGVERRTLQFIQPFAWARVHGERSELPSVRVRAEIRNVALHIEMRRSIAFQMEMRHLCSELKSTIAKLIRSEQCPRDTTS